MLTSLSGRDFLGLALGGGGGGNEVRDPWKGTTVFTVIALCEALHYHGEL
jgi:hypothetical protein